MSEDDVIKSESTEEEQPIKTKLGKPLIGNIMKKDKKDTDG